MKITQQQAEKILNGNQSFAQYGFSMMVTRLKKKYFQSPTPLTLQECANEMNDFLQKYVKIMGPDYETITKMR